MLSTFNEYSSSSLLNSLAWTEARVHEDHKTGKQPSKENHEGIRAPSVELDTRSTSTVF